MTEPGPARVPRRMLVTAAAAAVALALTACTGDGSGDGSSDASASGPADLTAALLRIQSQPQYHGTDWGYIAIDQNTGEVLAGRNADALFDAGSTMKSFAVAAALDAYGSEHTFDTPVHRIGEISGGVLTGDLVLVGSGDLSFGLRQEPDGSLSYESMPALDHSYATIGIPGAVMPSGDPLAVLDEFAAAVRGAGITAVAGDVIVDDRLFEAIAWPDGLVSPIWVNENLIDIEVSPGVAAGDPVAVQWRPQVAPYSVESQVETIAADGDPQLSVTETSPGHLVVSGALPAGSAPMLTVKEIADPSAFARTAFIEALQRAGVTVAAPATGPNPAAELPDASAYSDTTRIAEHRSASLGAYVELIMKVSYNRGADLMTCLAAVATGSTNCDDGIVAEVDNLTELGVSETAVFPFDGAGSDDHSRVSPRALATFYRSVAGTPYAAAYRDALPILGVDGTLGNVLSDSPVAGAALLKTGNRAVGTPAGQMILLGNSLAGYVEGASGRRFTVMIAMGNMPFRTMDEFLSVTDDQAAMVAAMRDAF